ncbi:MAG: hypothetical protein AAF146_03025 [Bacteroidota bacterium]
MIADIRARYNREFTPEKYQAMLQTVADAYQHQPAFRIAETPVFLPPELKAMLLEACEEITDVLCRPDFKDLSQSAILKGQVVPGETDHTTFLQMDFGLCVDEHGKISPQLIEVQGFPSLYFFQDLLARSYRQHFNIPTNFTHLLGGLNSESYIELLRKIIIGDSRPEEVVLLEVDPHKQVTQIDFWAGEALLGFKTKCVTDIKVSGKDLYYLNEAVKKVGIEKIYNRVIFDELIHRDDLQRDFYFTKEANVQWIGHPHWFFRISKHTLPLLDSQYVPKTYFLHELETLPDDLENYVLKPLYSFAGTGVLINVNRYDLDSIKDRENYILQRKVNYAPVVETPDQPAKCEIRMLMLWERGAPRPLIVNNLARLSKGEMIGVRYNKDKDWVGGSIGYFPQ